MIARAGTDLNPRRTSPYSPRSRKRQTPTQQNRETTAIYGMEVHNICAEEILSENFVLRVIDRYNVPSPSMLRSSSDS